MNITKPRKKQPKFAHLARGEAPQKKRACPTFNFLSAAKYRWRLLFVKVIMQSARYFPNVSASVSPVVKEYRAGGG